MNKTSKSKPTIDFYPFLQGAFEHFNKQLFGGDLPNCLIIIERNNSVGHFTPKQWVNGELAATHEICLNPSYFLAFPKIAIFQTLVHEMCHLWQHEFGTPGRGRYHNIEWAKKMESIGLMPSDSGEPGGKKTGDSMDDYPMANGAFITECCIFISKNEWLPWVDRFPEGSHNFSNAVLSQFRKHLKANPGHIESIELLTSGANGISSHNYNPKGTGDANEEIEQRDAAPHVDMVDYTVKDTPTPVVVKSSVALNTSKSKYKYTCSCGNNFWGKDSISAVCLDCNNKFEIVL